MRSLLLWRQVPGEKWLAGIGTSSEDPDTDVLLSGKPHLPATLFYLSRNRSFGCIAQRQGQGDVSIPQKRQPYFPAIHASLGAGLQLLAFSEEGANREEGEKGTDLIGQGQKRLGRFTHLRNEVQDSLQLRRLVVSANLRAGTVPG